MVCWLFDRIAMSGINAEMWYDFDTWIHISCMLLGLNSNLVVGTRVYSIRCCTGTHLFVDNLSCNERTVARLQSDCIHSGVKFLSYCRRGWLIAFNRGELVRSYTIPTYVTRLLCTIWRPVNAQCMQCLSVYIIIHATRTIVSGCTHCIWCGLKVCIFSCDWF